MDAEGEIKIHTLPSGHDNVELHVSKERADALRAHLDDRNFYTNRFEEKHQTILKVTTCGPGETVERLRDCLERVYDSVQLF